MPKSSVTCLEVCLGSKFFFSTLGNLVKLAIVSRPKVLNSTGTEASRPAGACPATAPPEARRYFGNKSRIVLLYAQIDLVERLYKSTHLMHDKVSIGLAYNDTHTSIIGDNLSITDKHLSDQYYIHP